MLPLLLLSTIAERAAQAHGSIAYEFELGIEERDEDVDVGSVSERTE